VEVGADDHGGRGRVSVFRPDHDQLGLDFGGQAGRFGVFAEGGEQGRRADEADPGDAVFGETAMRQGRVRPRRMSMASRSAA
jgi:hypothetical protein